MIGDDDLVIKAQREGKRRDRTKDKLIYSKDMHLEDNKGFIIVYKNKTKDQGLSETLQTDNINKDKAEI